jgi:hypothetical protein
VGVQCISTWKPAGNTVPHRSTHDLFQDSFLVARSSGLRAEVEFWKARAMQFVRAGLEDDMEWLVANGCAPSV